MEKYENDLAVLNVSLEELYAALHKDRQRSKYLQDVIKRHEPIVMEERRLQSLEDKKELLRQRQRRASVRIQAWWRGTMVRKELGRFRPVKEKPHKAKNSKKK
ncbi:Iq domain-containing protein g [Plakobranchus ocellatus]|uniref:Dynein regulatory complex protein 9 n=1 Tax=Plakobranchus ocellatus TaxID=259542 RepID=A0AAV3YRU6_9GAST|nr:Iq domain-containing protein g [Plakobranchus ocellatus]